MGTLEKIRELQNARNWTDLELAKHADLPIATVNSLFRRNNPPKLDTLQCICKAFGLTLAQFFLEDESVEVLSKPEKEMLEAFRTLSPKQQQALIEVFTEKT